MLNNKEQSYMKDNGNTMLNNKHHSTKLYEQHGNTMLKTYSTQQSSMKNHKNTMMDKKEQALNRQTATIRSKEEVLTKSQFEASKLKLCERNNYFERNQLSLQIQFS
jgi:hypothetical protein